MGGPRGRSPLACSLAKYSPSTGCPCDKLDNNWKNFQAPWRQQSYTILTWNPPSHPLFETDWAWPHFSAIDPAHTLDKGICEHLLGSLFYELTYEHQLAARGTVAQQVVVLNTCLISWYKENHINAQVSSISLTDFVDTSAPHRNAPQYSSGSMSKTRSLVPFGLHLSQLFHAGSDRDSHREAAFKSMLFILDTIYRGPDHLGSATVHQLQHEIDSFLAHYCWLNWNARMMKNMSYHIVYKHNYLVHFGEDSQWLNPRVGGCCLADEDFVGRMSKLIRGVIKGRAVTKLMGAFVEQYARAVLVRWSGAECGPL